jgi:hypothetical protein
MRADYATSDLINKVNSDWINEVLVSPELDRASPDDDRDLMSRRRWGEPVWPSTSSAEADDYEPDIEELMAPRPRPRSVARRVTERLALAVAALAVFWAGVWIAPEPQSMTNSATARATNAPPEPAADVNTAALRPAWLAPEILYGPAMARSIPVLRPGR